MTIFIRTGGGGRVVLLVALALLASHGGVSAALAVVIVLAVAVVLAVAGLGAYLAYRARNPSPGGFVRTPVVRMPVVCELPAERPAIEPVRLHPDQLAELAEIIRRGARPE